MHKVIHIQTVTYWPTYEEAFGDSGKENLPFNRKKSLAKPGSERGSYLHSKGRITGQKTVWKRAGD